MLISYPFLINRIVKIIIELKKKSFESFNLLRSFCKVISMFIIFKILSQKLNKLSFETLLFGSLKFSRIHFDCVVDCQVVACSIVASDLSVYFMKTDKSCQSYPNPLEKIHSLCLWFGYLFQKMHEYVQYEGALHTKM